MVKFRDHLWNGRLNKKETEKVKDILFDVLARNKEIEKLHQRELKENEKFRGHIKDLKRKIAAQESHSAAVKSELNSTRKEVSSKDARLHELEQKLKTISKDNEELLRRRVHALEREARIIAHDLSDLNEQLASSRASLAAKDAMCRELQRELQASCLEKENLADQLRRLETKAAASDNRLSAATAPEKSAPAFKQKGRRLGIFVDTRNVAQACRLLQQKMDYRKLLDFILLDRHLVKAVAYVLLNPDTDRRPFLNVLEQNGFQVRTRDLIRFTDGSIQGNWGAGMAADVIHVTEKMSLDVVHLVGGDGDFVDLVRFLKVKGIHTEVSGFPVNSSQDLIQAAGEFVPLGSEILRVPFTSGDNARR
jgi:uncharacterized LabA/DUF88 family protein